MTAEREGKVATPTFFDQVRETRLLDFLLGALLVFEGVVIQFAVPLSYFGAILLVMVGVTRKPTVRLGRWNWVFPLLGILFLYVGLVSFQSPSMGGSDWTRRMLRLLIIAALTYVLATGRLHAASVIKGLAISMVANAALFFAGVAPHDYGEALSGYFGDKNKAGLFYAVVGLLLAALLITRAARFFWILFFGTMVWLTLSRTSISAFTFGLVWALVFARLPFVLRWGAGGTIITAMNYLEDNFAQAGIFENRWGSDLLRARIDAAAAEKLAAAPWWGMGLGQAFVTIDGNQWFFHNAYETLLVEGGWPYAIGVVAITGFVCLRPFAPGTRLYTARMIQGTGLALLICALRLGEVFLTIPWALLMGVALYQWGKVDGPSSDELGAPLASSNTQARAHHG